LQDFSCGLQKHLHMTAEVKLFKIFLQNFKIHLAFFINLWYNNENVFIMGVF